MDNHIVSVYLDACVWYNNHPSYGPEAIMELESLDIPNHIRRWIQDNTEIPTEEEDTVNYQEMKIEFEIEVVSNDNGKAIDATLQHEDVPNYVKGWLEHKAMEQFNHSHRGDKS